MFANFTPALVESVPATSWCFIMAWVITRLSNQDFPFKNELTKPAFVAGKDDSNSTKTTRRRIDNVQMYFSMPFNFNKSCLFFLYNPFRQRMESRYELLSITSN